MQRNQRFVWLNHYHHSTKLHRKQYHSLVAVGIVTHAGDSYNTDGNKLAIFSSIPLYYGDTVISLLLTLPWLRGNSTTDVVYTKGKLCNVHAAPQNLRVAQRTDIHT